MEVYNFPFSCKNQKEYKAYLRCFPAADGLCEVNDQTGGRGQLSMRALVFLTSALYPPKSLQIKTFLLFLAIFTALST